jgi:hypothetical protein
VIDVNDINDLLKLAARRLNGSAFISALHIVGVVAAAAALALMIADRLPAAAFVPWMWVAPALAIMAIAVALSLWTRRRSNALHVAVEVDERLQLREKLSTALLCQGRDDVFARAAVEDAVAVARDPRSRELIRRRFAILPPKGWWLSPSILLAVVLVSFLTQFNVFARDAEPQSDVNGVRNQVKESLDAVVKVITEKPELTRELEALVGELSKEGTDPNALKSPDDIKRDAIKKFTGIENKLDEIINGEKGKTAEALKNDLNQLKSPESGPAKDLADAMAKGDFSAAQKAIQEMQQRLQDGQLTEEQKKELAEQLENIAKQLEQLAQQQQKLEQALQQAGLDPKLAQNPQALQQALQQNQNLNQQQKQMIQQMAQAQQQAAQMCQGMSKACGQMAQACQGGQPGQLGQAGQAMMDQLSQAEALQELLKQAQAAANACKGQCQGLGQNLALGQFEGNGGGMGNRGQGAGGKAPMAPTPVKTKIEQAKTKTTEGDIIAKMLFEGPQIRGESKAKLLEVVAEASKGFDEGMEEDQLPRQYHEVHQHYFGELEKLTQLVEAEAGETEPVAADAGSAGEGSGDKKPGE